MTAKSIRVELDCGHIRWFRLGFLPPVGDAIWCFSCENYEPAGPAEAKKARSIQDDFESVPVGKGRYTGTCLYQSNESDERCGHTEEKVLNWHQLRERMHKHYMNKHSSFGTVVFETVDRLPPNAHPPF